MLRLLQNWVKSVSDMEKEAQDDELMEGYEIVEDSDKGRKEHDS